MVYLCKTTKRTTVLIWCDIGVIYGFWASTERELAYFGSAFTGLAWGRETNGMSNFCIWQEANLCHDTARDLERLCQTGHRHPCVPDSGSVQEFCAGKIEFPVHTVGRFRIEHPHQLCWIYTHSKRNWPVYHRWLISTGMTLAMD